MTLNFVIAPDFAPEHFAGWHLLNTVLQKQTELALHLRTPAHAAEQAQLVQAGQADVLYANPFDAAALIRDQGYRALARPINKANEMVILARADADFDCVEDLQAGLRVALTPNHDVKLIGLRLLEPADLLEADLQWQELESYQAAARALIKGEADICFMLAEAYHSLSRLSKAQLKVLVESQLADISHVVLLHPQHSAYADTLRQALLDLPEDVRQALGIPSGFAAMNEEEAEFMIDLMDTLLS